MRLTLLIVLQFQFWLGTSKADLNGPCTNATEVVFIMDEKPPDATTYFTLREIAQSLVEGSRKRSKFYVTFVTRDFNKAGRSTFNLIASCTAADNFTESIWRSRPTRESKDGFESFNIGCTKCVSVVQLVSKPMKLMDTFLKIFPSADIVSISGYKIEAKYYGSIFSWSGNLEQWKSFDPSFDFYTRGAASVIYFFDRNIFCLSLVTGNESTCLNLSKSSLRSTFIGLKGKRQDTPNYETTKNVALSWCSWKDHVLLTLRSKQDVSTFVNNSLKTVNTLAEFSKMNLSKLEIVIGLRQRVGDVTNRFQWVDNRDLLFSHWAPGEPRDRSSKRCVRWRFVQSKNTGEWLDEKWHSVGCGAVTAHVVICRQKKQPRNKSLTYTPDFNTSVADALRKGSFGQLASDNDRAVPTSATSAFTVSRTEQYQLLRHLLSLSHSCGDELDDESSSPTDVPLSMVCDGKTDCGSGSDEESCGYSGDTTCSLTDFTCKSGQCVPQKARCDLIQDCQDGTDEEACETECPHRECTGGRCLPRAWFFNGQPDCEDSGDETGFATVHDDCVIICNRNKCISKDMLNDSTEDCSGPEGPLDETLGALEPYTCTPQDGSSDYLNNWAPKCVLARDLLGQIIGCRDFQHLSHCEDFKCPKGYVKCPESFCIPLANVKDGKEDCDYGEDEGSDPLPDLENYFKCNPMKPQAVPLSAVCDGRRDCAQGEDELDCGRQCPAGFICLAGAISAMRYNKTLPLEDLTFIHPDTRYLDLSGVAGIGNFFSIYPLHHLPYLQSLQLSDCGLQTIQRNCPKQGNALKKSQLTRTVDLSYNKITELPGCSYLALMPNLEELNLTHNTLLTGVNRSFFTNMKELKILNMSYTAVAWLAQDVFDDLRHLEKLSLEGSRLHKIKFTLPGTFQYLNVERTQIVDVGTGIFSKVKGLSEVRSSTFKLCCPQVLGPKVPSHICHYSGHAISSCRNLIKEPILQLLAWLVGLATLTGNVMTLAYRLIWDKEILKKPYGLFVTNLCVSDLLMGVYVLIIAMANSFYYENYVFHDYTWRKSRICQAAGVLVTMTSFTSMLLISLITVERYLAVRYPHEEIRLSACTVNATLLATWLFGLSSALTPLLPFTKLWEIFSTNVMCVALPFSTEKHPGQWYSATFFLGVSLVFYIFIGVGQGAIFWALRKTEKQTLKHSTASTSSQLRRIQKMKEFAVAKQLPLVVMSNFLCWTPVISMRLMALLGVPLGEDVYSWAALLLLPINSALNPVLYTLPEIRKRFEQFRDRRRQPKRDALARRRRQRRLIFRRSLCALVRIRRRILARPLQDKLLVQNLELLNSKIKMLTRNNRKNN
ncbi:hypothetical protein RRG08_021867 [Elysia crispata]|uniref:G-protein coupled receptors family 1 profile domain-containing protein n=1 Tax=Elysia crispata TaxID=231223 RepID=A0AAE0XEG8_9GAST|nr:hypothetical protein RRG08_021867 [Elysia crispata]